MSFLLFVGALAATKYYQRFRFRRAGHDAAVVVRQDHHRPALEAGIEDPFAGDVEVVGIDQGKSVHPLRFLPVRPVPRWRCGAGG